jgi:Pvc16 N-terminal domain
MAILNLFKVTKTLTDLLSHNITKNIDTSLSGVLNVTAIPPEKVENASNTLSIFLYHVAEDPFYKNALGPGSDVPNVAKAPMALSLFYILTAHHESDSTFDPETQQKLMGYALKTFHDIPVVTKRTQVNGTPLLDPEFGNDRIQIILRPVTPEEALAFWTSEDIHTVRLSAYYEVRVVMLEPEPPKTMPGIVLNLGAFLFQLGTSYLDRSQSVVHFRIPAKNGGFIEEIEATPARVTLDSSATAPAAHNRFVLLGTNLSSGKSRALFLKSNIWSNLSPPLGPIDEAVVDPTINPGWNVDFQSDRIGVKVAPLLHHIKLDGTAVDLPLLPGYYTALERTVLDEKVINNELKRIVQSSNEVGVTVAPRIEGHDPPDGAGNIQIHLGSEFDLLDANLPSDAIQVIVAGDVYVRVPTDPPANAKEFFVTNTPSNRIRIRPDFPVTVTQPETHALGLLVNGAPAAPFWIELNP